VYSVDAAEVRQRGRHSALDRDAIGYVAFHSQRCSTQIRRSLTRLIEINIRDDHRRAFACAGQGAFAADSAGRSG
jgi:hypothetical protein